ncbi:MAG: hypothetical protein KKF53_03915, partial [Nanoarchaeota archaeon]|nr:hypothetical protein [Nanoarchaeota archaeon]MBU1445414.1 hypothetical protein [Nanoarchaeota archaeon]MBU2420187.1 hypothetical protein [Nanoarchaeota archaeon]
FSVFNVNNGSNRSVENSFFNLFNQQASEDSYCGDGTCRNEETCKNCIKDCGDCRETNYY